MSACVIISKCKISKFLPDSVKLFKFHVIFLYIQTVLNTFLPQETDDYNFSQKISTLSHLFGKNKLSLFVF